MKYDPQKALLVDHAPTGPRWIHELKLDGFRMGILIAGAGVRIISRRGTEYTAAYPEVVDAARRLGAKSAMIDGEVVVLDERGISSFQRLQQLGASRRGLAYFAFDLLTLDGKDLTGQPLLERKALLHQLLGRANGVIRFTEHFEGDGATVFAKACELGAEGIVSKLGDAPYRTGARSSDWQKTKCIKRQEFVIGGFTDPEGSRNGVGSVLIGYYEGNALRFAGKVGNGPGWNDAFGRKLRKQLEGIAADHSPFTPLPKGWLGRNAHWVKPELVAEVAFAEWTGGGNVRHPSLQGFRTDKKPREVVREREARVAAGSPRPSAGRSSAGAPEARMVFPRVHLRCNDLVELYTEIADWALPHVQGRPLTLVRMKRPITAADALRTQAAFVHHTRRDQAFVPDVVPRMQIEEKRKTGEYCYVDSIEALIALIAAGVVEWHVWNAKVDEVEQPDRVVFDLDPGDGVTWPTLVAGARRLRTLLEKRDLESWVKTTGGKGLHVVVPFKPEHDWDAVFDFSRQVAGALEAEDETKYTTTFDKSKRKGRILIDYKRNYRTSIAVAGFSLRARPDATISVPVRWEELGRIRSDQFNAVNLRGRLRRLRRDPWEGYWKSRQRIKL